MTKPVIAWLRKNYSSEVAQIRVAEAYQKAIASDKGAVLEDLRRFCMVYDTTHVPGDPQGTAINEGKRQVYLHLVNMLEVTPEEIKPPKGKDNEDDRDAERPPIADD